jgi:hypothetical protein
MIIDLNEDEIVDIIMALNIMDDGFDKIFAGKIIKEDVKKLKEKFRDMLEKVM